MIECKICGTIFEPRHKGHFLCSKRCVCDNNKNLDETEVIRLYESGLGMKAIAKQLLGSASKKTTIRDTLRRNGVRIRTVQETAKDPQTIARKLIARGIVPRSLLHKKKPKPKQSSVSELPLFDMARKKAKKIRIQQAHQKKDDHAVKAGYKSHYHMRYQTEPRFRMEVVFKSRFKRIVKGNGHQSERMMRLLGCDGDELRRWIESQMEEWMTWENYGGDGGWHIDHIVPCSWFDHENDKHLAACWNYRNLRPLSATKNHARRDFTHAFSQDDFDRLNSLDDCEVKETLVSISKLMTETGPEAPMSQLLVF